MREKGRGKVTPREGGGGYYGCRYVNSYEGFVGGGEGAGEGHRGTMDVDM